MGEIALKKKKKKKVKIKFSIDLIISYKILFNLMFGDQTIIFEGEYCHGTKFL